MPADGVVPALRGGVSSCYLGCRVLGMTTQTQKMLDEIERKFIEIATHVKFQNKKGRTDINDDMERFFKQVLNAQNDYKLKTANEKISSFPAIDLRDDVNGICYQITSTNTTTKIKGTIKTFKDNKMFNDFKELIFLILTDQPTCNIIDPSPNEPMVTSVSIFSLADLDFQISRINEESIIRNIHQLAMEEYRPAAGSSGYLIKAPDKSYFGSMQRLFDQAGYDWKTQQREMKIYEKDFTDFVRILERMDIEQRAVLQRLVVKSELRSNSHVWLYYDSARVRFEFKGEHDALDSIENICFDIEHDFQSKYERPFTAICLKSFTSAEVDLNIFAELKTLSDNDDDLLREMIVRLDFKCLEY